jgi:hypothetical protein
MSENQKCAGFVKPRLLKKEWAIRHEKCPFFFGHGFSPEIMITPHLKFYLKEKVLLIYRMMKRLLDFCRRMTGFRATESSRYFGT